MIEINDNGELTLTLTVKGETISKDLDAYEAFGVVMDAHEQRQGRTAWLAAVRDWLTSQGFPVCSLYAADEFASAVMKAVEGLKKKDGAGQTPSLPASTEPAPSASLAATS